MWWDACKVFFLAYFEYLLRCSSELGERKLRCCKWSEKKANLLQILFSSHQILPWQISHDISPCLFFWISLSKFTLSFKNCESLNTEREFFRVAWNDDVTEPAALLQDFLVVFPSYLISRMLSTPMKFQPTRCHPFSLMSHEPFFHRVRDARMTIGF